MPRPRRWRLLPHAMRAPMSRARKSLIGAWARVRLHATGGRYTTRSGHVLFLDPGDTAARKVVRRRGGCPETVPVWSRICDEIEPTIVIDVGANYGQTVFSRAYPHARETHLFEANPALCEFLERAIAVQGDPRVVLHRGAAGDEEGIITLSIRHRHSGLSTIHGENPDRWDRSIRVPIGRVSDQVHVRPDDRVAFKIDVEGADVEALQGMEPLLAQVASFAGLIEIVHLDDAARGYLFDHYSMFGIVKPCHQLVLLRGVADMARHSGLASNAVIRPPALGSG